MRETMIAGRYRLAELLGQSGMSEVWCATDVELDRRVALKLLAPNADVARFEREARAVAALAHPNVNQLFDYGEDGERPYMVLEFLPGGTLEDVLRRQRGPLADVKAAAIASDIALGLAHAHSRGVVHRDLKPANVLFDEEGRAKIADFGIARLSAGDGTLTEAGTVLGTAAYISPEQAAGEPATAASDIYSFGVILFRMLTGRLPFEGDDPLELVTLHRDAPVPPVASIRPNAPAALAAATDAALAKNPTARPQDGAALLATLDGATDATRVMAPPPPPAPRRRRRSRAVVFALLLVLALGGVALAYAITRPSDTPTAPPTTTLPKLPKTTTHAHTTTTAQTTNTTAPTTTTVPVTTVHTTTTVPRTTTPPPPPPPPTTTAPPPPTTTTEPTTTTPATTG